LSVVAVFRPEELLKMSSSVAGSRPARTPTTIASPVIVTAVADSRLLSSLAIWPWPGSSPT
jgi:hypothetical protein